MDHYVTMIDKRPCMILTIIVVCIEAKQYAFRNVDFFNPPHMDVMYTVFLLMFQKDV